MYEYNIIYSAIIYLKKYETKIKVYFILRNNIKYKYIIIFTEMVIDSNQEVLLCISNCKKE